MKKRTANSMLIFSICTFLLVACKKFKEKDTTEEPTALQVVEKGIELAGTMEKWKNIASLEYTKKSRLLLENGEVESDVNQRHHYIYRPDKSVRISWVVDKDSFLIVHNDSVSQKFKNDSLVDQGASVKATVNSATYVLGMPFKLLDTGTALSYSGLKSFNATDTVHAVNALPTLHSSIKIILHKMNGGTISIKIQERLWARWCTMPLPTRSLRTCP